MFLSLAAQIQQKFPKQIFYFSRVSNPKWMGGLLPLLYTPRMNYNENSGTASEKLANMASYYRQLKSYFHILILHFYYIFINTWIQIQNAMTHEIFSTDILYIRASYLFDTLVLLTKNKTYLEFSAKRNKLSCNKATAYFVTFLCFTSRLL